MERLTCPIQTYAWGSTTAIPALLGQVPSGEPAAEMWIGTHERGPARLPDGSLLGDRVQLPFLLKILAAAQPLSIQAHPDKAQAEAGFARENAAGIPIDARHRSYRDANHKPELICALTPFQALCGFRDPIATGELLAALAVPGLAPVLAALGGADTAGAIRDALAHLLEMPDDAAASLTAEVAAACAAAPPSGPFAAERGWAVRCAQLYPEGAGVVVSLLLNLITLEPGQALFLRAGNLHAYLEGVGIEILAESDNVLRGGMTAKHVDVPELLAAVDTQPGRPAVQTSARGSHRFETPVPDFCLTRVSASTTEQRRPDPMGPGEVVLSLDGVTTLTDAEEMLQLEAGQAAWIPARPGTYAIETSGSATAFVASTPGQPVP